MKKINSYLVITLTVITIFVMCSLKINNVEVTSTIQNDESFEVITDDDTTGYIFDDFNKDINIKLEDKQDKKEQNKKVNFNHLYDIYKTYIMSEYYNQDNTKSEYFVLEAKQTQTAYNVKEMENLISLDDKALIFSMIRYLKPADVVKINNIIKDGVTIEETEDIFNLLKLRLPQEKYNELMTVVDKYNN
ncbi:MAG: hypothetical protein N2594_02935 [Clostridiales bacterium]|nr:hypothetical protein [Clostridiales bacterium]